MTLPRVASSQPRQLLLHLGQRGAKIGHALLFLLNHGGRCLGDKILIVELVVGFGDFGFQARGFLAQAGALGILVNFHEQGQACFANHGHGRGLGGSAGQLAAGAAGVGNTFGAAIANRRLLGAAESKTMTVAAVVLIGVAAVAALWPQALAWPLAAFAGWSAIALLLRAGRLRRKAREQSGTERVPPR